MAKRRTVRPRRTGKKRRSAAQRAATARMLAANRSRRSGSTGGTKRRRRRSTAKVSAPRRRARKLRGRRRQRGFVNLGAVTRGRSRARGRRRSSGGGGSAGISLSVNSAMGALKEAGFAGVGAVGVDVAMGQVARFLPDGWNTSMNGDGSVNLKYTAVKCGVALGVGYVGTRFLSGTLRQLAVAAAKGSLTIQAYQMARAYVPADMLTLGFPSRTSPSIGRVGADNVRPIPFRRPGIGQPPVYRSRAYSGPVG